MRARQPAAFYLVGAMILLPYAVAAVVVRTVRRGETGGRP
jgi:hypothetical protein